MSNESDADVVAALWDEYKSKGTVDARERLILNYAPLVKFVAGRVASGLPQSVDQSDLVSYGIFGLIDAIDKFEPERGWKFETYAISRIKGAIIDELRSIDWVPRSVHTKARKIQGVMHELEQKKGRLATDEEMARALLAAGGVALPSHVAFVASDFSPQELDETLERALAEGVAKVNGRALQQQQHGCAGRRVHRETGQQVQRAVVAGRHLQRRASQLGPS